MDRTPSQAFFEQLVLRRTSGDAVHQKAQGAGIAYRRQSLGADEASHAHAGLYSCWNISPNNTERPMERPWVMILCSHSFAAFHTFILCAYLVKLCARLYCWKYHSATGTFTTSSIIMMKYTASVGRCGQKAAVSARGAIMPPTSTAAVRIQPAQRRACSHKRSHALFGQIFAIFCVENF